MKWLSREQVEPIISARAFRLIFARMGSVRPSFRSGRARLLHSYRRLTQIRRGGFYHIRSEHRTVRPFAQTLSETGHVNSGNPFGVRIAAMKTRNVICLDQPASSPEGNLAIADTAFERR